MSFSGTRVQLDHDGTIIVVHGIVNSIGRMEFIEAALDAIAKFNRASIPVAGLTNQADLSQDLHEIDHIGRAHQYIAERLAEHGAHTDLFLYCPYHSAGVVEAAAR
jgi:D-sedoheptulose 7-phosphate isomerase/D-glycero-D-manno-heptose 1,7-bisphosphate phosphatase